MKTLSIFSTIVLFLTVNLANAESESKQVSILKKGAAQGDIMSQRMLAPHYSTGRGVPKNLKKAFELSLNVAKDDLGNIQDWFIVGQMYQQGKGIAQNYDKAIECYLKADHYGFSPLASIYYKGEGVPVNHDLALKYFELASLGGLIGGSNYYNRSALAEMYLRGQGTSKNLITAYAWASHSNDIRSQSIRALAASQLSSAQLAKAKRKKNELTKKLLGKADRFTISDLQTSKGLQSFSTLALHYSFGVGVEKDLKKAFSLRQKAAEHKFSGWFEKQSLAEAYEHALGVPMDLAKANEWYRKAANAGSYDAMMILAEKSLKGSGGLALNSQKALEYYKKAALMGRIDAQLKLAQLYRQGSKVPKDIIRAFAWSSISDMDEVVKVRDSIAEEIDLKQLPEAKKKSDQLKEKISQMTGQQLPPTPPLVFKNK